MLSKLPPGAWYVGGQQACLIKEGATGLLNKGGGNRLAK